MKSRDIEFWLGLIGKLDSDPDIRELVVASGKSIVSEHQVGYLELLSDGISIMFKRSYALQQPTTGVADGPYYVNAVHLHSSGHDGYEEYRGSLVDGVLFGDSELTIINKLSCFPTKGGGNYSTILKRQLPKWIECIVGNGHIRFTLSPMGSLIMVTLF